MSERPTPELIAPLVARFERRRPLRAGSLVVTLYGDAIAPRGGSLWLGSLNTLVEPFGIEPGLVRTAMSRLVSEGWFERNRAGKNSFYRLSARGAAEFAEASGRIYRAGDPAWDGAVSLAILTTEDAKRRQSLRDELTAAGFGQLAPTVMVGPAEPKADATSATDVIWLQAQSDKPCDLTRLTQSAWNIGALASAYQSFLDDLAPLAGAPGKVRKLQGLDAFRLRILLIHEWRRIVLRDPQLPAAMLPSDWPGQRARAHVREIYAACLAAGDAYISAHAVNESGPLPAPDAAVGLRFGQ